MSLLWGATDDGTGSAARPSTWRPTGLPRRMRNLIVSAGCGAAVAFVAAQLLFGQGADHSPAGASAPLAIATPETSPTPKELVADVMTAPETSPTSGNPAASSLSEYAVAAYEIAGLPPDVQPGQEMELWVAWESDIVGGPAVQRLVKNVILVRLIEPATPEGPVVAVLGVRPDKIENLMYAEKYGSFGVALKSSAAPAG